MTETTKKGFDLPRNSIYVADPIAELRIIGGAKLLHGDERGDIDTEDDKTHPLWDAERLQEVLTEEFIANIDAYGVLEPVLIAKIDGVPTVVAGRTRIRGARVVNRRRAKRGEPLIKVDCKVVRGDDSRLLGVMVAENEGRRDNSVMGKIEKLKRMLARGVSIDDAAITFNVDVQTAKAWLSFEDNATDETKAAVKSGRVSASAAAEIARVKEPEKQNEVLTSLLTAPGKRGASTTAARTAALRARGKKGPPTKPQIEKLLASIQNMDHPHAGEKTLAWWEGVEEALKLVLGEKDVDERLVNAREKAEAA